MNPLKEKYLNEVVPAMQKSLNLENPMQYPKIEKVVVNIGLGEALDNPKALVIENNPKSEDEIQYNPKALMVAKHLGTELNACPCYWPRKKGKVLSAVLYYPHIFSGDRCYAGNPLKMCG